MYLTINFIQLVDMHEYYKLKLAMEMELYPCDSNVIFIAFVCT